MAQTACMPAETINSTNLAQNKDAMCCAMKIQLDSEPNTVKDIDVVCIPAGVPPRTLPTHKDSSVASSTMTFCRQIVTAIFTL